MPRVNSKVFYKLPYMANLKRKMYDPILLNLHTRLCLDIGTSRYQVFENCNTEARTGARRGRLQVNILFHVLSTFSGFR